MLVTKTSGLHRGIEPWLHMQADIRPTFGSPGYQSLLCRRERFIFVLAVAT